MKLIDKDAVVSWVTEKREAALYRQHNLEKIGQETCENQMIADNLGRMLSFLDTLEVKEINLDSYYHEFLEKEWFNNSHVRTVSEMMAFTARHFFELGMAVGKEKEV